MSNVTIPLNASNTASVSVSVGSVTVVGDYEKLSNRPKIGGVELIGNKTAEQLGLVGTSDDYLVDAEVEGDTLTITKSDGSEVEFQGGGGGGHPDWADIQNKPSTFTPSAHTHAQSEVTGLVSALAGKQDAISDLSTIRSGAAAGATAYQLPSGGVPKTDLASAVQISLGKADTALQEHQSLSAYRTSAAQDVIDAGKAASVHTHNAGEVSFDGTQTYTAGTVGAAVVSQSADIATLGTSKQDVISDLSTIRSGAALGATAVQPETGKGLYPDADATKLAGIETGADVTDAANVAASGAQMVSNLVTSVSSASTDIQYPSAKLLYDTVGNVESLLAALL